MYRIYLAGMLFLTINYYCYDAVYACPAKGIDDQVVC
jgi:hypothetical protein